MRRDRSSDLINRPPAVDLDDGQIQLLGTLLDVAG
jgi:hypothetical protein